MMAKLNARNVADLIRTRSTVDDALLAIQVARSGFHNPWSPMLVLRLHERDRGSTSGPWSPLRQLGFGQPEIIDTLHQIFKRLKLHWFAEVAVRLQFVAFRDIRLSIGRGRITVGMLFKFSSALM
jgi:hypothetical protein